MVRREHSWAILIVYIHFGNPSVNAFEEEVWRSWRSIKFNSWKAYKGLVREKMRRVTNKSV
jgi:uncharacterized membrane protein